MSGDQQTWDAVDGFVGATILEDDDALRGALDAAVEAGLPEIQVSPALGKLLQLLVKLVAGPSGCWSSAPSAATARS